jgi:hypothetical protein
MIMQAVSLPDINLLLVHVPEAEYLSWDDLVKLATERNLQAANDLLSDAQSMLNLEAGAIAACRPEVTVLRRVAEMIDAEKGTYPRLKNDIDAIVALLRQAAGT